MRNFGPLTVKRYGKDSIDVDSIRSTGSSFWINESYISITPLARIYGGEGYVKEPKSGRLKELESLGKILMYYLLSFPAREIEVSENVIESFNLDQYKLVVTRDDVDQKIIVEVKSK